MLGSLQMTNPHGNQGASHYTKDNRSFDVFAHLTQLTAFHIQQSMYPDYGSPKVSTEDLRGISHLTRLQSLTIVTVSRPSVNTSESLKLVAHATHSMLSGLTCLKALHVDTVPLDVTCLRSLRSLSVRHVETRSEIFRDMHALQTLTKLTIHARLWRNGDLVALRELTSLRHLTGLSFGFWDNWTDRLRQSSDDAMALTHLSSLRQLAKLCLSVSSGVSAFGTEGFENVPDDALVYFQQHLPQVEVLTVTRCLSPGVTEVQDVLSRDLPVHELFRCGRVNAETFCQLF